MEEMIDGVSVLLSCVDRGAGEGRIMGTSELIHSIFVNQLERTSAEEAAEVSPLLFCRILSYTSRAAMLLPPKAHEDAGSLLDRRRFDDWCAEVVLVLVLSV